jgi:hypothetical protein
MVSPDQNDVNEVVTESSSVVDETEAELTEESLTQDDLSELDGKPVPYQRFREVNEKAKSYKRNVESLEQKYQDEIRQLTTQYEAKLMAKQSMQRDDDYSIEYEDDANKEVNKTVKALQDKINALESSYNRQSMESQIEKLQRQYPKADTLTVQGWKMAYPEAALEDLMEKSHQRNIDMVKSSINELLEKKKSKTKKAVPLGNPRIQIKEGERPKSFAEATKMANKFLNSL